MGMNPNAGLANRKFDFSRQVGQAGNCKSCGENFVNGGVRIIALSTRQEKIIEIVSTQGPITGAKIAAHLNLTRAALRSDLAILVMAGIIDARPKVGYFYTGKPAGTLLSEEINAIKVRDVQSVPIVVQPTTSVYETIVTLFLEDVGTIFIVEDHGTLVGLVSRKDLLKAALGGGDIKALPVQVIMTRMPNIITTYPDEPLLTAARKLIEREVDSLPVIKEREGSNAGTQCYEVVGRLTKTNITRVFTELGAGKRGSLL